MRNRQLVTVTTTTTAVTPSRTLVVVTPLLHAPVIRVMSGVSANRQITCS